jgi:uncharacterized membrane protein
MTDEYHQRQIAEAIARAERRTDAELVTVLARRADDYAYWPCSGPPCWRWPCRAVALAAGLAWRARPAGGQCCCSSACACCCATRAWPAG